MPPTNEFLTFCPTDTGTNLLTESEYTASADRTSGNKPGVASAKLNNRALRQANAVASQLAQMVANQLGSDVLDDGVSARLLSQFLATLKPYAPKMTVITSGSGTFSITHIFFIASGSATVGATYTNNGQTFTVLSTVSSATEVRMTGTGAPATNGTLTKASGTGDATLTFYSFRVPLYIISQLVGAGGGGGGAANVPACGGGGGGGGGGCSVLRIQSPSATYAYSVGAGGSAGTPSADGSSGGDTTFGSATASGGGGGGHGTSTVVPGGGAGGGVGSSGDVNFHGSSGSNGTFGVTGTQAGTGGTGGSSFLGGGGQGSLTSSGLVGTSYGGGGGGGTQNLNGGDGADGVIIVEEHFQ